MIWRALMVKGGREIATAAEIRRGLGLRTCVPCMRKSVRRIGKQGRIMQVPIAVPLMPGYAFVGAPYELPARDLLEVEHVLKFVQFGGVYCTLTDAQVDHMRRLARQFKLLSQPKSKFQVGDKIKITDGPFSSFERLIEEVKGADVRVDVKMLGHSTPMWLKEDQVEAVKVEAA